MPKRTYQPNTRRRQRKHGFRARAKKSPKVLRARRSKGRKRISL